MRATAMLFAFLLAAPCASGMLHVGQKSEDKSCQATDLKRRAQFQNKLASLCEEMCKELGAYPKCPHSFDGKLDPGFAESILELTYNNNLVIEQDSWLIPDNTNGVDVQACRTDFGSQEINSMESYTDSLRGSVKADFSGWGAAFSASTSWKHVKSGTASEHRTFMQSSATCTAFSILADSFTPPKVTDSFAAGINTLPTEYSNETASKFQFFIQNFGTHVMYGAEFGGVYGQVSEFTQKAWSKMKSDGLDVNVAASYSGLISAGASVNSSTAREEAESYNSNATQQYIFTKGGSYSSSKSTWMSSVRDAPMPLTYHLWELDVLLDSRFMPSTVDNASLAALPARKASLKAALAAYCGALLERGDLSSCAAPGPSPTPTEEVSKYMDWAYDYMPAAPTYYDFACPHHGYLTEMWWREQPTKGLVSLKATCSDGTNLRWGDDDDNGAWNQVMSCSNGFANIRAKSQSGYGIINVLADCIDQGTFQSNDNQDGEWQNTESCPSETPVIFGFEVMFQTGWPDDFGIVNYRPRCSNGNSFDRRRLQTTILV